MYVCMYVYIQKDKVTVKDIDIDVDVDVGVYVDADVNLDVDLDIDIDKDTHTHTHTYSAVHQDGLIPQAKMHIICLHRVGTMKACESLQLHSKAASVYIARSPGP